jgi:hypothetical protein
MASKRQPSPFDNFKVTRQNLRQSLDWFSFEIKKLNRSKYKESVLMGNANTAYPTPGSMYMFRYDAKWKDELPYWDAFPLIFFVEKKDAEHFYGINLHYLPPPLRLKLLIALYDLTNNDKFDATTRLKMSYDILMRLSRAKNLGADFAFKMYRFDHMESRFQQVYPTAWPMVALLPVENFQKASKQRVWHDAKQRV